MDYTVTAGKHDDGAQPISIIKSGRVRAEQLAELFRQCGYRSVRISLTTMCDHCEFADNCNGEECIAESLQYIDSVDSNQR